MWFLSLSHNSFVSPLCLHFTDRDCIESKGFNKVTGQILRSLLSFSESLFKQTPVEPHMLCFM